MKYIRRCSWCNKIIWNILTRVRIISNGNYYHFKCFEYKVRSDIGIDPK